MDFRLLPTTAESSPGHSLGPTWSTSTNRSTDKNFCLMCSSRLSDCPRPMIANDHSNWQSLKDGFFVARLSFFNDNNKWGKAMGNRDAETSTKHRKLYSSAIFYPKLTKSSRHRNKLSRASIPSNWSRLHLRSLYSVDLSEEATSHVPQKTDFLPYFQVSTSTSTKTWLSTINLTWEITGESVQWTSVPLTSWNL